MAIPWLRILDTAFGIHDLVRVRRNPHAEAGLESRSLARGGSGVGGLEARFVGVIVASLKEAFARDTRRLELERQQFEAERRRMERTLQLELFRQAGDREIGRLRLVAGLAAGSFLGTLLFLPRFMGAGSWWGSKLMLGSGWALLLGAIALSFAAQSAVARALQRSLQGSVLPGESTDDFDALEAAAQFPRTSDLAPWLIVVGLALVGLAAILS
jgi:hypothetical protein